MQTVSTVTVWTSCCIFIQHSCDYNQQIHHDRTSKNLSEVCLRHLDIRIRLYVYYNQFYHCRVYKRKYIFVMVIASWLLGFGFLIPTWFNAWGQFGLDPEIGSCTILLDGNREYINPITYVCWCIILFQFRRPLPQRISLHHCIRSAMSLHCDLLCPNILHSPENRIENTGTTFK